MNLLKIIIAVGFGMMLLACGGENKKSVENVENGVPKTEDGRIVLSSEFEDLVILAGKAKGVVVDRQKLANAIANRFNSISEVFDISFMEEIHIQEIWSLGLDNLAGNGIFTVSFNIRTTKGSVYEDIQCSARSKLHKLILDDCKNDQVVLVSSFVNKFEINIVHIQEL